MQFKDTREMMADAKFFEAYSRYDDAAVGYESWEQSVKRVMDMHRTKYADKMTPALSEAIDFAEGVYKEKRVLGAQRALQFGGDQILKQNAKLYNCFSEDTSFVTSDGIKSFKDFSHGDAVTVMTHTGSFKPAVVKSYGTQKLNEIEFKRGQITKVVKATANHRWLLPDSETTDLQVGDRLVTEPSHQFDWDSATQQEQLHWLYGLVYGDGTINGKYSQIRLCGRKASFASRFETFGFKTSTNDKLKGDIYAYTGSYQKGLPIGEDTNLINAFVAGYLAADGAISPNKGGRKYEGIQATGKESINFIRDYFPVAGVHVLRERDYTGQVTNYGTRPPTVRFTTCDSTGNRKGFDWKVTSITPSKTEEVWCLEVEDDHSFILEGGLVTGNCTVSHANRMEFFGEAMHMLLCGAGVGFSVQSHHIEMMRELKPRGKRAKTFKVPDSIEGWAAAIDVLMSSFMSGDVKCPDFQGCHISFDLSEIRPRGSFISGGFKAPGPDPLRKALDLIEAKLHAAASEERKLKPIEAYDITMYAADAVISGGVRRSATICLFDVTDDEMMNSKTGDWFKENPQRGRSNNSAVILRDEITWDEFYPIMQKIKDFGEPGFIFTDNKEFAYNPCV